MKNSLSKKERRKRGQINFSSVIYFCARYLVYCSQLGWSISKQA